MTLVNIGCGAVYHRDWVNLDFVPNSRAVGRCDVLNLLPFAEGSVDAVYHSHLLEHLDADHGGLFLRECYRVLKPNGVIRVVVPDLEQIATQYLYHLELAARGGNNVLYEWCRMELTDQCARSKSGGAMLSFVTGLSEAGVNQVRTRAGREIDQMLKKESVERGRPEITIRRVWNAGGWAVLRVAAKLFGGERMVAAVKEGRFRQGGEVHRVMYDRVSLANKLGEARFSGVEKTTAFHSRIPQYSSYELDVVSDEIRKPDSLFMEAVKA